MFILNELPKEATSGQCPRSLKVPLPSAHTEKVGGGLITGWFLPVRENRPFIFMWWQLEMADLGVFHLFLSVWWLFLRVLLVYV